MSAIAIKVALSTSFSYSSKVWIILKERVSKKAHSTITAIILVDLTILLFVLAIIAYTMAVNLGVFRWD